MIRQFSTSSSILLQTIKRIVIMLQVLIILCNRGDELLNRCRNSIPVCAGAVVNIILFYCLQLPVGHLLRTAHFPLHLRGNHL